MASNEAVIMMVFLFWLVGLSKSLPCSHLIDTITSLTLRHFILNFYLQSSSFLHFMGYQVFPDSGDLILYSLSLEKFLSGSR